MKKKIIIIGAGVSGMSAGIYALDNDYDVVIYEKHKIVGGQCTGWYRDGVYIDGCAHWIVGTNPNSDLYPLWRHTGAFNADTKIFKTEYFCKYDIDGTVVTIYADLDKLEEEFLRISPIDKRKIKRFIGGIKAYQHVRIPVKKPIDKMNLFELTKFGINFLPMLFHFSLYQKTSSKDYADSFKSPVLREALHRIISGEYNVHSFFYIMQALSKNDAGMVEGGSLKFAFNMKDTFINHGGKIITNKEIKKVIIENHKVVGVEFIDGTKEYSDYVISSADAHHTIYDLLEGRYYDKYYMSRFENRKDNPLNTSMQISYKISKDISDLPKMLNFTTNSIEIASSSITNISLRNHAFDKSINPNNTTLTVLIDTKEDVYNYFNSLSKEEYLQAKNDLGEKVRNEIINYLHFNDEEIKLIDVTTPLTYQRYTNAYKGSYMSFITTNKAKGLMRKGSIKHLKNFILAGQWIMPPGGLPIALFSGKHAIYRICNLDHKKFIDKDNEYKNQGN